MGWLRDYLWLNSSQLINGYNPFGMNSLSVWAWMFLFGHLIMLLDSCFISWRGYWQELIESLAWAHERTPIADLVRWKINQLLFQSAFSWTSTLVLDIS
jgi:photosystem I P700 chlorophyll a apoprotein A2